MIKVVSFIAVMIAVLYWMFFTKKFYSVTFEQKVRYIAVDFYDGYRVSDQVSLVLENNQSVSLPARYFNPEGTVISKGYGHFQGFLFQDNKLYLVNGRSKNPHIDNPYITKTFIELAEFSHVTKEGQTLFKVLQPSNYTIQQAKSTHEQKRVFFDPMGGGSTLKREYQVNLVLGEWEFRTYNLEMIDRGGFEENNDAIFNNRYLSFSDFIYQGERLFYDLIQEQIPMERLEFEEIGTITKNPLPYELAFYYRPLEIILNKASYTKEDRFEFTIQNRTYRDLGYTKILVERPQQKDPLGWETVRSNPHCDCESHCEEVGFYLSPKAKQQFIWDLKTDLYGECRFAFSGGRYRVKILEDSKKYRVLGISKEFRIKD